MKDKEYVVKHLEMIQGIINRLGHDSFLIKGWSMAILAAGIIFIVRAGIQNEYIILTFLVPVVGFWILDGYFVRQERLFRELYKEIRKLDVTDFDMDTRQHKNKPKCWRICAAFSETLVIFYVIEIAFVTGVFCALQMLKEV